jgi:hypothetical protein
VTAEADPSGGLFVRFPTDMELPAGDLVGDIAFASPGLRGFQVRDLKVCVREAPEILLALWLLLLAAVVAVLLRCARMEVFILAEILMLYQWCIRLVSAGAALGRDLRPPQDSHPTLDALSARMTELRALLGAANHGYILANMVSAGCLVNLLEDVEKVLAAHKGLERALVPRPFISTPKVRHPGLGHVVRAGIGECDDSLALGMSIAAMNVPNSQVTIVRGH